jgi:hypothetical protein
VAVEIHRGSKLLFQVFILARGIFNHWPGRAVMGQTKCAAPTAKVFTDIHLCLFLHFYDPSNSEQKNFAQLFILLGLSYIHAAFCLHFLILALTAATKFPHCVETRNDFHVVMPLPHFHGSENRVISIC